MAGKTFTLEELSKLTDAKLIGEPQYVITNVADLETAGPQDAAFLGNPRYEQAMRRSAAGVIFIGKSVDLPSGTNFLLTDNPSVAFQKTIEAFYEPSRQKFSSFTGIHPTAVIHDSCKLSKTATIGPHAVIDSNVIIGDNTFIGAGCYIGPETTIGNDCMIHPHVTIREQCIIGNRVILQPGAVIGACGFGYTTDQKGKHTKLNQLGNVTIEDDVEIGANTTIDRARFKTTRISSGTKIDNLVQIGHAVIVGNDNIIVSQTGIAGSTVTGKNVVIAGQVAVIGHIKIADHVVISGKSGVTKSLTEAGAYGGTPAMKIKEYNRNTVFLRNIESYVNRIKALEEKVTSN